MTNRLPVGLFFALFTVSGFAGLIYESIWSHYLKLFLGHAAYAQTLVLAIFMGGMAIGSWLVSRYTHRIANLLLGYAAAEFGIGILAIVFHRVFVTATGWAYESVLPALGAGGVDAFKWTLASLLILPGSILLGTTFPLMSAGIIRLYPQASGRALSMLYFTNSFGAALGVLASGFYLIDRFGLPGAILTAGLLNVILALVVWALARNLRAAVAEEPAQAMRPQARDLKFGNAILLLAAATGAASFIYEITWIRMLTMALGASTHSFEMMLSAFILGMALGAFWIRNRIDRYSENTAWLAGLLVVKAMCAVYAVWVFGDVLGAMQWFMSAVARTDGGYLLMTSFGLVASLLVMLPTAFCAGVTLPLATRALTQRGHGEASIGRVYGANTAGCIVGAAFATHVGMQWLGIKGLTGLGAVVDVAAAALIFSFAAHSPHRGRVFASVGAAVVIGIAVFLATGMDLLRMSSGVYRTGGFIEPGTSQLDFYRDGKTATVAVITTQLRRSIRTNGKPDASIQLDPAKPATGDEPTGSLAGTLPLAMLPNAQSAAIVGFGSGLTTHALLGSPTLREVDTIEIEPMMVEGARLFLPNNQRAYDDPRSHIFIEDAKTFFAARGKRYDIIISEPSNPWVSGVSTLFSEEFYRQVKPHLNPGGLLVQWIQAYEINVGLVSSIFIALGKSYPDYAVYTAGADLLVVATPAQRLPPLDPAVFAFPGAGSELRRLGFHEIGDLKALRIGGRRALEPLFLQAGYAPNSDFFPILDQHAPRSRFKSENADLRSIRDVLLPVLPMLDEEERTSRERLEMPGINQPIRVEQARVGVQAIEILRNGDSQKARDPDSSRAALLLRSFLGECSHAQQQWLESLTEVASAVAPFLERKDLAAVLDQAQSSRCFRSLDERGRQRVRLLQAINDRDAEAMTVHATSLLQALPRSGESERAHYVMAAMLGHLAKGRRDEARALVEKHFPLIAPADRNSLHMRLLVAHALAREQR